MGAGSFALIGESGDTKATSSFYETLLAMAVDEVLTYDAQTQQYLCKGDWRLANVTTLQRIAQLQPKTTPDKIIIDGSDIQSMDSAGAYFLSQFMHRIEKNNIQVVLQNFAEKFNTLIDLIEKEVKTGLKPPPVKKQIWLEKFGYDSINRLYDFIYYLNFVGKLTFESIRIVRKGNRFRWSQIAGTIYLHGYGALPLIGLLSFMIGVVITYQMAVQLRNYGADIYIIDFLGAFVLRELGPLLTAIIVAGRTGAAFTAQLGIMKINQEIDALTTMGVTPTELLLWPKIIGLLILLPLLTMWANIFGILGGMVTSFDMLNISWYDFLHRFGHVFTVRTLNVGLIKTPVFALIIATIACFEGMQVKNNANSLGLNTTKSVVLSIFFIIVTDAVFSIIFSKLNL